VRVLAAAPAATSPRHAPRPATSRPAALAAAPPPTTSWLRALAVALLLAPRPAAAATSWLHALAVAQAAAPATPTTAPATLQARIDAILAAKPLAGATIGVHVVDLATGAALYSREADLAMNPASNIKLVTTAAALALLGPEHRYVTRVYADKGALRGGTIHGDLYLRGGGDPALITADLYQLASDLRALGVTRVTGGLVLDTTLFDRDELPPGFDQKEELVAYRAPGGALSVNFGTYVVMVRPGAAAGDRAHAAIDPPVPSIALENEATTEPEGRTRLRLSVETEPKGHGLKVRLAGSIGVAAEPAEYRYPVASPADYTGEVFRLVLAQRGVKLGKPGVRLAAVPDDAARLAIVRSQPLSVLVRSVNKLSNNYMAEHILKTLDAATPQTYAGGLQRTRAWATELSVAGDGFRMTNGSGLYDTNRISAAQLVRLLVAVHRDFRIAGDFMASLPIAGADGTLRSRLQEGPATRFVRAKTGSLDTVSALSGYAGALGKPPIAFSVLIGGIDKWKAAAAKQAQNEIAALLAAEAAARP
jgi:D-alanyl-D-alanine carboxypeptidase/D-alanyl-D-alanine-endopeptidase (penicillin-binding protein 4)